MREWWSATAANYFGSVPKARVLEVVRGTVSPEAAAALAKLKKAALTQAAEEKLAGSGWLSALLRNVARRSDVSTLNPGVTFTLGFF